MRKSVVRLVVTVSMVCLLAISAFADITGDLQGTVLDATGAGDCFFASVTHYLVAESAPPRRALELASQAVAAYLRSASA